MKKMENVWLWPCRLKLNMTRRLKKKTAPRMQDFTDSGKGYNGKEVNIEI